jgi:hypothetical protein
MRPTGTEKVDFSKKWGKKESKTYLPQKQTDWKNHQKNQKRTRKRQRKTTK